MSATSEPAPAVANALNQSSFSKSSHYVRAGRAKVVVACTLRLSDSGDDQINHALCRNSLAVSSLMSLES